MADEEIAKLRTGAARPDERMNTPDERMSAKQAGYKTDIGKLAAECNTDFAGIRADIGRIATEYNTGFGKLAAECSTGFAEIRADIGRIAAKTEADIGKLATDMAKLETRVMLAIMGAAIFVTAVLGIALSRPVGG